MIFYTYLTIAIFFTSAGQLLFKYYSKTKHKLILIPTFFSFIAVPFFSYKALIGLTIDTVYMATAITIVLVLFGGIIFFKEKISKAQLLSSLIIILGIIIYNIK